MGRAGAHPSGCSPLHPCFSGSASPGRLGTPQGARPTTPRICSSAGPGTTLWKPLPALLDGDITSCPSHHLTGCSLRCQLPTGTILQMNPFPGCSRGLHDDVLGSALADAKALNASGAHVFSWVLEGRQAASGYDSLNHRLWCGDGEGQGGLSGSGSKAPEAPGSWQHSQSPLFCSGRS